MKKKRITNLFFKYYINTEFGKEAYDTDEAKEACYEYECKPIINVYSGLEVYNTICTLLGDDKDAAVWFKSIGYIGLKYKDNEDVCSYTNYVIFDESNIKIISKEKIQKPLNV